jgi:hypothetical protein
MLTQIADHAVAAELQLHHGGTTVDDFPQDMRVLLQCSGERRLGKASVHHICCRHAQLIHPHLFPDRLRRPSPIPRYTNKFGIEDQDWRRTRQPWRGP